MGLLESLLQENFKKMISNLLVLSFSNSADYTSWGGGIRTVRLPASACLQTPNWKESGRAERIHRLCCANTHVICEEGRTQAELRSYDGGVYVLNGSEANGWLDDAFSRICAMPMARRYRDCKASLCVGAR